MRDSTQVGRFALTARVVTAWCAPAALGAPVAARSLSAQDDAALAAAEGDTLPVDAGEVAASTAQRTLSPAVVDMLRSAVAALESDAPSEAASLPLRQVSARDAAALIQYERGHPTLVVVYCASCPRSHLTLTYAREVAARHESTGLSVRAFAYGHTPSELREYVGRLPLTHQPLLLEPWRPGELTRAMTSVGVPLGRHFRQPFVALLDGEGRAVGRWRVTNIMEFVGAAQGIDAALTAMH